MSKVAQGGRGCRQDSILKVAQVRWHGVGESAGKGMLEMVGSRWHGQDGVGEGVGEMAHLRQCK